MVRTNTTNVNTATWTPEQGNLSNENILLDVNGANIFDVNGDQIYVLGELVPYAQRTDQFDRIVTARS